MDKAEVIQPSETYKIMCSYYPEAFELDKSLCKNYFRQFGKVVRLIFKSKQRAIVVEYTNKHDYLNALAGPSEYEGQSFKLVPFEPGVPPSPRLQSEVATTKKRTREKVVKRHKLAYLNPQEVIRKPNISYIDNDEVNEELAAMSSTYTQDIIDLTAEERPPQPKPKKAPILNRVWRRGDTIASKPSIEKPKSVVATKKKLIQTLVKNKMKEKTKMLTAEQLELLKLIRLQAHTVEERYKVLDARDKLLRSNIKKSRLKSSPTVGTCPDMCPEKERLLREIKHQVSMYEQDNNSRHVMDHTKAVKQYSRSSADQESPLPHELRPVTVLQLTMTYLMYNIMDLSESDSDINIGDWFHYLWDRTRSIRKDITQQALCCQGSVGLVEQCARFHIHCSARLMGEDPSVFDQKINTENLTKCLQTLKYMYHDLELKGEKCPNEAEFRAYIILLNLSDGNFMWEVQKLRRDIQKSPEMKFALQIYSAFEKRNYVKFFKLIKSTTYLNTCVLMRYFVQVRVQALEILIRCFTPPKSISFYPVQELSNLLFFDEVDSAIEFMKSYGIGLNKDGSSFMIERSSFSVPEYTYVLERSQCVESKRNSSVGTTVNGKELSPEMYMQMQSHEVHNSFDKDGYLIQDEIFNKIELSIEEKLLEDEDSRESTPEKKNIVTNIFAQKAPPNITLKRTVSPNIFMSKEEKNIFTQPKQIEPANIFTQPKSDVGNVFVPSKPQPVNIFSQGKTESMLVGPDSIFTNTVAKREAATIFKPTDEIDNNTANKFKENIFAPTTSAVKDMPNIFAGKPASGAFGKSIGEGRNIFSKPNIFTPNTQPSKTAVSESPNSQENIFEPKKGGFYFELNRSEKNKEVPNIFAIAFKPISDSDSDERKQKDKNEAEIRLQEKIGMEIEKKRQEKLELEELEKRNEEIRRKNEEAAERRRLEAERIKREEIERKNREEQERIEREKKLEQKRIEREKHLEQERKRLEEELKIKQAKIERLRKEQEEKEKNEEIQRTVKSVITEMVETVDLNIRQETLKRIRQNMKRRFLIKICKKWRSIAVRRMKKRKAMDCNPIFVHTKSVRQCAKDLYSKSQDLALSNMKRYKYGKPLDIPLMDEQPTGKLNLLYLTYSSLRRRFCELKEKWHQHIYWKVVVSIPDIDETITGLHKLEETLKSYINWQLDKYGSTAYIEQHKTVTYCIEKQQGLEVKNSNANAFIFIAKDFNDLMQRRVFENLKGFGIYVRLPIVLILENIANSEKYLQNLRDTGIVSDFIIYSCNLSSHVLPGIIDNGLIFLSKRVEKYPPLEMDTLYSFLTKNLCSEMWKKAGSYARWNHEYNFCMRDPNIVIGLYNEGLKLLSKIITDKKTKEYAEFPEEFRDYLPNKVPEFLPCDYRYFPSFWTTPLYEEHLKSVLKKLHLPKFLEKWPPENETELLVSISKYCTDVFKNPKNPLIELMNILKQGVNNNNFHKFIWTEAIQVIARHKLKDQDLQLPKKIVSDVFDSYIVIYDVNVLNEYCSTEWFYRNNPLIESFKKIIANKLEEEKEDHNMLKSMRKRTLDTSFDHEDISNIISKAENILKSPKNMRLETKGQIEHLNRSIKDLEDSIYVVKRMDEMNLLKRFIEN